MQIKKKDTKHLTRDPNTHPNPSGMWLIYIYIYLFWAFYLNTPTKLDMG